MHKFVFLFFSILAVLLLSFFTVNAKDNKVPIVIEADKFEYDNKAKVAVYKDNVVVKKGDFILYADIMHVFFNTDSKIKKIVAEGHVRFKKGEYSGSSKKAIYLDDRKLIKLIGNAKVRKKNSVLEGDEIDYYMQQDRAVVIGKNKKVRTIIIPAEMNNSQDKSK